MHNLQDYTIVFHFIVFVLGIILYQLYKLYHENALLRSVFLCIENGELEKVGSYFGIKEYIVKRGRFVFLIEEETSALSEITRIRIFHKENLVFEKSSWDFMGQSCKKISNKINNKLKAA